MSKLIPALAGGVAVTLVASVGAATALHKNDVTVVVDGQPTTIAVREDTVAEVLELEDITVGEHDVVTPAADTRVTDGMEIVVNYGRLLQLTVDGDERQVWTTAQSVEAALDHIGVDHKDAKLSASRSTPLGREGLELEVTTAKTVSVTAGGKVTSVRAAGTVADALAEVNLKPDADDKVTPAATAALTEGMKITMVKVEVKQREQVVDLPLEKKTEKSAKLDKGEEKVTTKGVPGQVRYLFNDTFHDGVLADSTQVNKLVVREGVAEVTTVGTKEKPKQKAKEESAEKNSAKDSKKKSDTKDSDKKSKGSKESSSDAKTSKSKSSGLTPAKGSTCKASYYWDPQPTASGERFNTWDMTAAHKTLPMQSKVKVTNLANGRTTVVRINDRGPYIAGRCLDLSTAAMRALGGESAGVINVAYEVVG